MLVGGAFAVLHGRHDQLSAVHGVAAGEHPRVSGSAAARIGNQGSAVVEDHAGKALRESAQLRLADRDDRELATMQIPRGELDRGQSAVRVAHEALGDRPLDQHDTGQPGELELVRVAAHLAGGAAVEHAHLRYAEPGELAGGIDGGVAAADDDRAPHLRAESLGAELHRLHRILEP